MFSVALYLNDVMLYLCRNSEVFYEKMCFAIKAKMNIFLKCLYKYMIFLHETCVDLKKESIVC